MVLPSTGTEGGPDKEVLKMRDFTNLERKNQVRENDAQSSQICVWDRMREVICMQEVIEEQIPLRLINRGELFAGLHMEREFE